MPIPKYVSAQEYSRQTGMGVETVKDLCRNGKLKHQMTKGRILQNITRQRRFSTKKAI